MPQDFDQQISIVVNKDLASWQALNTVAHISAYLGNKLNDRFGTGEFFTSHDDIRHPRNTQYPIIIFAVEKSDLPLFAHTVRTAGLLYLGFIREMLEATNDAEIEIAVSQKKEDVIEYLGVGAFGSKVQLKLLTKKFSLWK